ncbi:MAG: hypothetical protein AAGB12_07275 [Pseudomonadota bacterium]
MLGFTNTLTVITLFLFLSGCAHYPDVRPTTEGIHTISFTAERKNEGYTEAFSQAKDFCRDVQFGNAFVVSERSDYIGNIDETTYNTLKTASQVTSAIGTAGAILGGGEKDRRLGGVAAVGGIIADDAVGHGYRYTMKFRCQ